MKLQFLLGAASIPCAVLAAPTPHPWCMRPSQPCWKIKRAVDALHGHSTRATTTTTISGANRETALAKATSDINIFAAAAFEHLSRLAAQTLAASDALPDPALTKNDKRDAPLWCLQQGEDAICWKRAAEQVSEVEKRWCMRPSQPCWKVKRAAESILDADDDDDGQTQQDCDADDSACSFAKRQLDDLHQVARAIVETF